MIGGVVDPGPFESFPGMLGTTGLIGSSVSVPPGLLENLTPGKGDREEALQSFNQANLGALGQGGFSTAGMSLDDLAAAWGVSVDSAAALAEAGFAPGFGGSADFEGSGFGAGGYGTGGFAGSDPSGPSFGDYGTEGYAGSDPEGPAGDPGDGDPGDGEE
jgi:hypothetical protein